MLVMVKDLNLNVNFPFVDGDCFVCPASLEKVIIAAASLTIKIAVGMLIAIWLPQVSRVRLRGTLT